VALNRAALPPVFGDGGGLGGGGGAEGHANAAGTALVRVVRSVDRLSDGDEDAVRRAVNSDSVCAVPGARPSWSSCTVALLCPRPPRSSTRAPSTNSQASSAPA